MLGTSSLGNIVLAASFIELIHDLNNWCLTNVRGSSSGIACWAQDLRKAYCSGFDKTFVQFFTK